MRSLQKVWDGPFKTPQLEQPISVGWVLLKILETLWRAVVVLLLLIAAVLAFVWWSEAHPLASQVTVQLSRSQEWCRARGWPIEAFITNNSRKTLGQIDLKFRVYPFGSSQDVAAYAVGSTPELNRIIAPGGVLDWCFSMPQIDSDAKGPFTIAADVTSVSELPNNVPATTAPPTR